MLVAGLQTIQKIHIIPDSRHIISLRAVNVYKQMKSKLLL